MMTAPPASAQRPLLPDASAPRLSGPGPAAPIGYRRPGDRPGDVVSRPHRARTGRDVGRRPPGELGDRPAGGAAPAPEVPRGGRFAVIVTKTCANPASNANRTRKVSP